MAKSDKKAADKNISGVDTSKAEGRTNEQTLDQAIEKESLAVATNEKSEGVVVESLSAYYKADPGMVAEKLRAKVEPLKKIADAAKARQAASEAEAEAKQKVQAAAIAQAEAEGKVLVTVTKRFKLNHDNVTTEYKPGTYSMPKSHAEHWYSKNNGVVVHGK